jgi:cell division protein FtsL
MHNTLSARGRSNSGRQRRTTNVGALEQQRLRLVQAYSQAPWRRQLQIVGTFLLILVAVAVVAGIYLNITTRATAMGRDIQNMQVHVSGYYSLNTDPGSGSVPIEELEQNISDLKAKIAYLTSYDVMEARAEQLGLKPVDPDHILYLEVPGYVQQQEAIMAPPPQPVVVSASGISPEFKESLIDFIEQQLAQMTRLFGGLNRP